MNVSCIVSNVVHKLSYFLIAVSYLVSVNWYESKSANICVRLFMYLIHTFVYIWQVTFNISSHTLQLHWDQCLFSPLCFYSHIHKRHSHILLVVWQYSYMCITLPATTIEPRQTTRHSGNIHHLARSACVVVSLGRWRTLFPIQIWKRMSVFS